MRNLNFIKSFSALLALWYIVSIIGFDLHICGSTGESHVATFIKGMTCEDIHPEHLAVHGCGHGHEGCCHDGCEEDGIAAEPCCTDDYQVLSITGSRSGNDEDKFVCYSCHCSHSPLIHAMAQDVHVPPYPYVLHLKTGIPGIFRSCDLLSSYGVLRI